MKQAKLVFLDRDGVINKDRRDAYVANWRSFQFIPGSLRALKLLKEGNYKVVVLSNQAGVAKGLYSLRELQAITRRMKQEVQRHGGRLDAVYYCVHHPEDRCGCRKPRTGLFRKAKRKFGVPFRKTYMIGDSIRDIAAGKKLGCRTVLVLSGKEKLSQRQRWSVQPDIIKKNLLEAARWILRKDDLR
ncbi:MAG: D-glycero-beta-D-manno-heptose 1,7-bisphosphate 7-phosphatase [Candidatus Omnitrophota bacterium]